MLKYGINDYISYRIVILAEFLKKTNDYVCVVKERVIDLKDLCFVASFRHQEKILARGMD